MSDPKNTVRILTRPRTMSGQRGGRILTFPKDVAADWIARGWADPAPAEEVTPKGAVAKVIESAGIALLALLMFTGLAQAAATRFEIIPSGTYLTGGSATQAFSLTTSQNLAVTVEVTSCAGTPGTLDVWLQASDDGGTTWFDYPADIDLMGTGASTSRTSGTIAGPLRNITGVAGHAVTTKNTYTAVYRGIANDRIRLSYIITTFTSCVFNAAAVAK